MADASYHAKPGLSFHSLQDFKKSPAFYYRKHILKSIPRTTSAAMEFGTAVHMAVLEHPRFCETYITAPEDMLTPTGGIKDNKDSRAWLDSIKPQVPLSPKDMARITAMRSACLEHDVASAILKDCVTEAERFVNRDGVTIKGCADILHGNGVYDLKTIDDLANAEESIELFGYTEQLAWYRKLFDVAHVGIIFVESKEPYRVKCMRPTLDKLMIAQEKNENAFRSFLVCKDNDTWPGLAFPGWTIY
jgi:hypothetical protein